MTKKSAGILLYRMRGKIPEVFLVHPGGPFFAKKDLGAWSIPKGEFLEEEEALAAAKREFFEETGFQPAGEFHPLEPVRQKSGKIVYAWALKGDIDEMQIASNTFQMEWPPKSGKYKEYPEVDKGAWFDISTARQKIIPAQADFLDQLLARQML